MDLVVNKRDLKEIKTLIQRFVPVMKSETTSVAALCFCLDAMQKAAKDLEDSFNENDN